MAATHDQAQLEEEAPASDEELGEQEEFAEEEEVAVEEAVAAGTGIYNARDVVDHTFEELSFPEDMVQEVLGTWERYLRTAESREAAGEAIYAAIFEAAPSLHSLFKTPRAVMAMRFMNGLNLIIHTLADPKGLKIVVETLGFQHLDLEVTIPRVAIFRDAIVDLLQAEMGTQFTKKAKEGWLTFLNYVGGSYIYVRVKFADRLRILGSSWATANNTANALDKEGKEGASGEGGSGSGIQEGAKVIDVAQAANQAGDKEAGKKKSKKWFGKSKGMKGFSSNSDENSGKEGTSEGHGEGFQNTKVPTSFNEMFVFNAAVMGYGQATWMQEVLSSFDAIVRNVANSYRLQEECDVLSLRLAKCRGSIDLPSFKAVMLASLRSLVPKDWDSNHEVAWGWLWDNVERMLKSQMGKPKKWQEGLTKLWGSMDEETQMFVRREVYLKFFALAPAGQDYFKQSTTRLHFIADRVTQMSLDMFVAPKRMVEDISALGLRHVGYGIPTDLFGAFVTGCVQVVRGLTEDDDAEEAFRWSLSLISRILTRVINEGSTIVMKAINANSAKQLKKAVGCAPRGKRALWMLNVQVGTQSISPLMWAIEAGSLEAAAAIIVDLLTIRADRERYYYGMDTLFERHKEIIKTICAEANVLLPILLDGLVWRARSTENGFRRVNYYIKFFVVDAEDHFSQAIEWISDTKDPKIVCHPVIAMVSDMIWSKVAMKTFLYGKSWFVFNLILFILSQSVLNHLGSSQDHSDPDTEVQHNSFEIRVTIMICRAFIYIFSLGRLIYLNCTSIVDCIRAGDMIKIGCVKLPSYLLYWEKAASLLLTFCLICMLCVEPIVHCIAESNENSLFTEHCPAGQELQFGYSVVSSVAMLVYFSMLIDLSVFSTRVSAWALVCFRVLSEVALFLFGVVFFAMAFASAISSLEQHDPDFAGIPNSGLTLTKITFDMLDGSHFDMMENYPSVLVSAFLYITTTIVFLSNLLIAQLSCAYQETYQDMIGYARLNRCKIIKDTMPTVSKSRWESFAASLRLDERCEFGEGDLGIAGGIQTLEPANLHITTVDLIRRFGGSTSTAAQWPEEENGEDDEDDRLDRLGKLIDRYQKKASSYGKGSKKQGGSATGSSGGGNDSSALKESGSGSGGGGGEGGGSAASGSE